MCVCFEVILTIEKISISYYVGRQGSRYVLPCSDWTVGGAGNTAFAEQQLVQLVSSLIFCSVFAEDIEHELKSVFTSILISTSDHFVASLDFSNQGLSSLCQNTDA